MRYRWKANLSVFWELELALCWNLMYFQSPRAKGCLEILERKAKCVFIKSFQKKLLLKAELLERDQWTETRR